MADNVTGQEAVNRLDEAIRKAIERTLCEYSLTTVQVVSVLEEIKLDVWHQDYHRLERDGKLET